LSFTFRGMTAIRYTSASTSFRPKYIPISSADGVRSSQYQRGTRTPKASTIDD
jgi:hypothetical protein